MQSVYGFKQSQESNFLLTLDRIKETLHDELIKIGFEHRGKIADQEEQVVKYFKENYLHPSTSPIELEPKLFKIAEDAIRFYKTQVKRDGEEIRERMVNETEQLYVKYITLLKVMVEFAQIAEADYTNRLEKLMKVEKEKILQHLLSQNRIIAELRKNNQLSIESKRLSITLDSENLQEWYGMLKRDETFFENFRNAPDNFETQKQVLLYLVKDFLFKNESILNSLEEEDIKWAENKSVLKSMLSKTFKNIEDEEFKVIELLAISKNWEDDKEFFKDMYRFTVEEEEDYEPFIQEYSKHWASERIAKVDKILLNMALSEMVNFPNIPIKVTINEYIEISKEYSTPKSGQFINGMLDAIAKNFESSGKIKKSGRGLIDNKS